MTPRGAVREINLDGLPDNQRNWINDHTIYTHGYGFYAAYGNQRRPRVTRSSSRADGRRRPRRVRAARLLRRALPDLLRRRAPAVRRRASSTSRRVVTARSSVNNTYAGSGGVPRSARALRRLAYAIKYREANFLLSDAVNGSSRILDHRAPPSGSRRSPVAAARRQRLPRGRRGPGPVDRRRLHDLGELPQQPAHRARRGDVRLGGPALQRRHRRRRAGQLRAQRGQGDGRRLRRQRQALRLGHRRPDAQGVEQGLPGVGAPPLGDLGRPHGAHPLPAGPAQGAARAAHRVPRDEPG